MRRFKKSRFRSGKF